MKRILCLWFPRWPLERLWTDQPELRGQEVVLYEQTPQGSLRIVAATSPAARSGMPVAEALAMVSAEGDSPGTAIKTRPTGKQQNSASRAPHSRLHVLCHDPWADRQALAALAAACHRFSPTVGIEDGPRPSCLFLDLSGLPLAKAPWMEDPVLFSGTTIRAGMGATLGAAWGLARYGTRESGSPLCTASATAIRALPIAALRLHADTLALLSRLGLHRVGQVEALPRAALAVRFGPTLLLRLDQMFGRAAEAMLAPRITAELTAQFSFEAPVENPETIEAVCRSLMGQMCAPLAARQEGIVQCQYRFDCPPREPTCLTMGLFRSSASADHLWQLLRLRLESLRLKGAVAAVYLEVLATAPLAWHQQELFEPAERPSAAREAALLIDRLSNRLGRQAVTRATFLHDVQPEYACLNVPWTDWRAPRTERPAPLRARRPAAERRREQAGTKPSVAPRPLFLKIRPLLLHGLTQSRQGAPRTFFLSGQKYRLSRAWGPERIETGWWRTPLVRRDYYRVETASGSRYWIFHDLRSRQWFLHGEWD